MSETPSLLQEKIRSSLAAATAASTQPPPRRAALQNLITEPVAVNDAVDDVLGTSQGPAAEVAAPKVVAKEVPAAPVAVEVSIGDSSIISGGAGTLAMHEALKLAIGSSKSAVFKVAALQSGYTAEMSALAFEDINRIQASSVDAHAARVKLLRTLYSRVQEFSCGPIKFQDWLKLTAQGDYDTLMYGMYAATYPGENEFDVRCRHCGHENKLSIDVGSLARVENEGVYSEIRRLLDPKTDFKGAITGSLVGRTVQRKLPQSGIIAEIRNPSIKDYLEGVQWYVNAQDKSIGALPVDISGAEVTRTLTMYVPRLLVPVPGTVGSYLPMTDQAGRAGAIGRLSQVDGTALAAAVDAETKKLEVSYSLPDYNCASCSKKNEELYLDFEALLFIKLRGTA